jgi:hypothetical protein
LGGQDSLAVFVKKFENYPFKTCFQEKHVCKRAGTPGSPALQHQIWPGNISSARTDFKNFQSHVTVPYFSGLEISGPERYWQLPQFLR